MAEVRDGEIPLVSTQRAGQVDELAERRPALATSLDPRHAPVACASHRADPALATDIERLESLSTLGQLVAGVAHDLRNVVAAVTGHAHLILERPDVPPEIMGLAREIVEASQHGRNLANMLVRLAHAGPRRPRAVDLRRLVLDHETILRMVAGSRATLHVTTEPGSAWATVEPADVERVLLNLVLNARDAMPDGGIVHLTVLESTVPRPGGATLPIVVIEARDSGLGMDAQTMARMFEPFFTTKGDAGTGLGLAVVQQLVGSNGGFLEVESAVGEGTRVRVCFPTASETPPVE